MHVVTSNEANWYLQYVPADEKLRAEKHVFLTYAVTNPNPIPIPNPNPNPNPKPSPTPTPSPSPSPSPNQVRRPRALRRAHAPLSPQVYWYYHPLQ